MKNAYGMPIISRRRARSFIPTAIVVVFVLVVSCICVAQERAARDEWALDPADEESLVNLDREKAAIDASAKAWSTKAERISGSILRRARAEHPGGALTPEVRIELDRLKANTLGGHGVWYVASSTAPQPSAAKTAEAEAHGSK